jgi:pyruvate/2-oxoglutarate dehydrogenase complex dihydrolipoamide acyltransferase (E2) component
MTMSNLVEVKVPDIGDFAEVPIIDLFVKVGDSIKVDDAICTLESDKATMDVPSPVAGVVKEVLVQLGAKVGEGALLIKVESGASAATTETTAGPRVNPENAAKMETPATTPAAARWPLRSPAATPAVPTSSAKCSSSAPAPAVIPRLSARPTSA